MGKRTSPRENPRTASSASSGSISMPSCLHDVDCSKEETLCNRFPEPSIPLDNVVADLSSGEGVSPRLGPSRWPGQPVLRARRQSPSRTRDATRPRPSRRSRPRRKPRPRTRSLLLGRPASSRARALPDPQPSGQNDNGRVPLLAPAPARRGLQRLRSFPGLSRRTTMATVGQGLSSLPSSAAAPARRGGSPTDPVLRLGPGSGSAAPGTGRDELRTAFALRDRPPAAPARTVERSSYRHKSPPSSPHGNCARTTPSPSSTSLAQSSMSASRNVIKSRFPLCSGSSPI